MRHEAAPYRSEAFAEDLTEPADDRLLECFAWTVVLVSLVALMLL